MARGAFEFPVRAVLSSAREALSIERGAPVPVRLSVVVAGENRQLVAEKIVLLGVAAANPVVGDVLVDGEAATNSIFVQTRPSSPCAPRSKSGRWRASRG